MLISLKEQRSANGSSRVSGRSSNKRCAMNLAEFSIKNQVLSVIVIIMSLWGGWVAYQDMPRFEDP